LKAHIRVDAQALVYTMEFQDPLRVGTVTDGCAIDSKPGA
jgi:hypothetical protein